MQIITYNDGLKDQVIRFVQRIWLDLGRTMNLEGGENDLATIHQVYQAAGGEFWVVLNDENEVIGTAGLQPLSQTEGELARLYLDESCRGQGLGRDLVQRIIAKAKASGLKTIRLDTSKKLTSAYNLFLRTGFKTTRDLGDERQTVFMEFDVATKPIATEASADNLFYGVRDYQRAVRTLERLRQHLLWDFVVVGGIANRALYPEWAERNRAGVFNDLDVVLLPPDVAEFSAPISTTIKTHFFVNHISELARYFSMIDRQDFVGVDIFTSLRDVETQTMMLEGKSYLVLTPEERYLSMARDIYQTLSHDRALYPKHIEFMEFLRPRVDQQKIAAIWPAEAAIIRRGETYSFASFEEYLDRIRALLADKQSLIGQKSSGGQKRIYGSPRAEAFGITVENEADFYASYEAKRRFKQA